MPDILILPQRGTSNNPVIQFTGSAANSIRMEVLQSGSVAFLGKSGSLFSIVDSMQGSLMAVSDISGLPILEVFSDDKVVMGKYNSNALVVTGSSVGIGTNVPSQKLYVQGSSDMSGIYVKSTSARARITVDSQTTSYSSYYELNSGGSQIAFLDGHYDNSWLRIATTKSGASIRFETGTQVEAMRITSAGNVGIGTSSPSYLLHVAGTGYASSDFRAPIFYDSENTGYYADPSSTSNLNGLTVNGTLTGANVSISGTYKRSSAGIGYLDGNYSSVETTGTSGPIYCIGTSYAPTSTTLGSMYGVGYNYGNAGVGFSNTWGFYVASNGTARHFLDSDSGIGYAGGSYRAPIFYDKDNTNYYVDPAGTSVLGSTYISSHLYTSVNSVNPEIRTSGAGAAGLVIRDSNSAFRVQLYGDGTYYGFLGSTWGSWDIQKQIGGNLYLNNNTTYYLNTSAGSNLNGTLINNGGTAMTGGWNRNLYLVSTFPVIVFNSSNTKYSGIGVDYSTSVGGMYFWTNGSSSDISGTGTVAMSINTGNYVQAYGSFRAPIFYDTDDTGYYLDAASTSRIKRIDFNKTDNGNDGAVSMALNDGSVLMRGNGDNYHKIWYYDGIAFGTNIGHGIFRFYGETNTQRSSSTGGNTLRFSIDSTNGVAIAYGDMRAPIFYDSDNTGYYANPAGNSNFNRIDAVNYYTSGWFRNTTNGYGLYNEATTNHFYSDDGSYYNIAPSTSNASGLRLRTEGYGGTIRGYFYANSSNDVGILNTGGNWRMKIVGGDYGEFGGSSVRAQIFYDSNDTSYYVDPHQVSYQRSLYLGAHDSGTSEFRFGEDSGGWYGERWYWDSGYTAYRYSRYAGTDSVISYHDTRYTSKIYYGRNIEFDNYGLGIVGVYSSTRYQGVFSMGDAYKLPADGTSVSNLYGLTWSHPNAGGVAGNLNTHGLLALENGTFLASLCGSTRARDDMRAPLFYDNNDTSYYIDPNANDYAAKFRGGLRFGPNATWSKYLNVGTNSNIDNSNASIATTNGNLHIDAASGYDMYLNLYAGNNVYYGYGGSIRGGFYTDSSIRMPIFYDQNDTGYYCDPNSTTNLNRLVIQPRNDNYYVGTVNILNATSDWQSLTNTTGQFTVTQYNNISAYSNSPSNVYGYGAVMSWRTNNHSFQLYAAHTGDLAYKTQWNNDNYSGWCYPVVYNKNNSAWGGIYSTIMYDSSDTGYYSDPNSTSNLRSLRYGSSTLYSISSAAPKMYFSSSVGSSSINLEVLNDGTLSFMGSSGSLFDINNSYIGSLMSVNDISGMPILEVFSDDRVVMGAYGSNTLTVTGSYVGINTLDFSYTTSDNAGVVYGGPTNNRLFISGSIQLINNSDAIVFGRGSATFLKDEELGFGWGGGWYMQDGTYIRARNNKAIYTAGTILSDGDIRAPIFYDSNNTGYYVDPASTTNINTVYTADVYSSQWFRSSNSGYGLYNQSTTNHFYSDELPYYNIAPNSGTEVGLRLRIGYGGTIRGYFYANNSNDVGILNNGGSWRIRTVGGDYVLFDGSSIRAQLLYDSNNTGYYCDPASTSELSTINSDTHNVRAGNKLRVRYDGSNNYAATLDWHGLQLGNNGDNYIIAGRTNANGRLNIYTNNTSDFTSVNGTLSARFESDGSVYNYVSTRSPIFYDNNDSGYYLDPNSYSNLYRTSTYLAAKDQNGNWVTAFQNTPTSAMAFHGDVSSGGPTGTWWFYQSMRHSNSGNYWGTQIAYGWEDNANEIYQRNVTGNSFSSWVRYLNTNNYSSYALARGGDTMTGVLYFRSNRGGSAYYLGADNTAQLQVYSSDASAAFMSFHRGGYYAVNMGLDPDNVFRIGGWSASANRLELDMSGNLWSASSMRSPIFYDNNNTGYYFDGASTSNMNNVQISTLGVGTAASGTGGEIRATNNITAYYSDERLKTKLGPIENPIEKVKSLSGFYFSPNDTAMALGYKKTVDVGVSAQEVKAILPEIIAPAPIDPQYMTVRYEKLIPLLIEAIKEQQTQIDSLKNQISTLLSKNG